MINYANSQNPNQAQEASDGPNPSQNSIEDKTQETNENDSYDYTDDNGKNKGVWYNARTKCWLACVKGSGRHLRVFSVKKHGYKKAKRLAVECKNATFYNYNNNSMPNGVKHENRSNCYNSSNSNEENNNKSEDGRNIREHVENYKMSNSVKFTNNNYNNMDEYINTKEMKYPKNKKNNNGDIYTHIPYDDNTNFSKNNILMENDNLNINDGILNKKRRYNTRRCNYKYGNGVEKNQENGNSDILGNNINASINNTNANIKFFKNMNDLNNEENEEYNNNLYSILKGDGISINTMDDNMYRKYDKVYENGLNNCQIENQKKNNKIKDKISCLVKSSKSSFTATTDDRNNNNHNFTANYNNINNINIMNGNKNFNFSANTTNSKHNNIQRNYNNNIDNHVSNTNIIGNNNCLITDKDFQIDSPEQTNEEMIFIKGGNYDYNENIRKKNKYNNECEGTFIFSHEYYSDYGNKNNEDAKTNFIDLTREALALILKDLKKNVIPKIPVGIEKRERYSNSLRLCLKSAKLTKHINELEPYLELFSECIKNNKLPSHMNLNAQLFYLDKL
ncbi:transcription factor with AP2 domain(s), putative [Plasmodium berghei]|nr:transcription factor with AP2 domain(s), putative [Plasmodium berghei]SCM16407.1 transcription factor with AP2 domain(s), putative [Plasmodium berghei]SCM18201.1 transcription factor with AP2 domain(s), putative [Plasmodium berghei]SCN27629.1 transcription factor with AP2 domain(s), putative [Plasmodium berghei]